MPVLRYLDPDDSTWKEAGVAGPTGSTGATGPTGPDALGGDEVVISAVEPVDPAIELWMDLSGDVPVGARVPIGGILAFNGGATPDGFHLCDGSAHGSAELEAVIGSPTTPDLRGRFIAGADGVGYTAGSTGGVDTVALVTAELPVHAHAGASGAMSANASHAHTGTVAQSASLNHTHAYTQVTGGAPTGGGIPSYFYISEGNPISSGANVQYVDLAHAHGFTMDAVNIDHTHAVTSEGSGAAHENRPPYQAFNYIIRKA